MSQDLALSAIRVGPPWQSIWTPACVGGHRALMERVNNRYGYECPECQWFLSEEDWQDFLIRSVPR